MTSLPDPPASASQPPLLVTVGRLEASIASLQDLVLERLTAMNERLAQVEGRLGGNNGVELETKLINLADSLRTEMQTMVADVKQNVDTRAAEIQDTTPAWAVELGDRLDRLATAEAAAASAPTADPQLAQLVVQSDEIREALRAIIG